MQISLFFYRISQVPSKTCMKWWIIFTPIKEVTAASGSSGESISCPPVTPRWADAGRCREFSSFKTKQAQGLKPPWPRALHTNAFNTVLQPVGVMLGTSVGLGIARTDSGWRDGAENTTLTLWKQEQNRKNCRGPPWKKKKEKRNWVWQIQYL